VLDTGPVHGIEPFHEINLPHPQDYKIKYDGQLTPPLLYQIHIKYKVRGHRDINLCISDDIHDVVQRRAENGLDIKYMTMLTRKNLLTGFGVRSHRYDD